MAKQVHTPPLPRRPRRSIIVRGLQSKKIRAAKQYIAEFNRALYDSIEKAAERLRRYGLLVERLPHLTTLNIERPADMDWRTFKRAIRSVLRHPRASVVLFSATGKVFVCTNRGNQPGLFVRYM